MAVLHWVSILRAASMRLISTALHCSLARISNRLKSISFRAASGFITTDKARHKPFLPVMPNAQTFQGFQKSQIVLIGGIEFDSPHFFHEPCRCAFQLVFRYTEMIH